MHSHLISYIVLCSPEEDQIHNGATVHVAYLIPLPIPYQAGMLLTKSTGIFRL